MSSLKPIKKIIKKLLKRLRQQLLMITDGNKGLENAVDMVFPLTPRQRCWAHKMRNVALTAFYNTPKTLWKKLRTTNIIERAFREARRRTRTMSCFNNLASIERIVFAVLNHLNDQWGKTPVYEFTQRC